MNNAQVPTLANPMTNMSTVIVIQSYVNLVHVFHHIPADEVIAVFRIIGRIVDTMYQSALEFRTCPAGRHASRRMIIQEVLNTWHLYRTDPAYNRRSPTWAGIHAHGVLGLLIQDKIDIYNNVGKNEAVEHFGDTVSPGEVWFVKKLFVADTSGTLQRYFGEYVFRQPKYTAPEDLPDRVSDSHYRRSIEAFNQDSTLLGMKELLQKYATKVSPDRNGVPQALGAYLVLAQLAGEAWKERLTKTPSLQNDLMFPSKLKEVIANMTEEFNTQLHTWKTPVPRQYRKAILEQNLGTDLIILLNHVFHVHIVPPGTILAEDDLANLPLKYRKFVLDAALHKDCDVYGYVKLEAQKHYTARFGAKVAQEMLA